MGPALGIHQSVLDGTMPGELDGVELVVLGETMDGLALE